MCHAQQVCSRPARLSQIRPRSSWAPVRSSLLTDERVTWRPPREPEPEWGLRAGLSPAVGRARPRVFWVVTAQLGKRCQMYSILCHPRSKRPKCHHQPARAGGGPEAISPPRSRFSRGLAARFRPVGCEHPLCASGCSELGTSTPVDPWTPLGGTGVGTGSCSEMNQPKVTVRPGGQWRQVPGLQHCPPMTQGVKGQRDPRGPQWNTAFQGAWNCSNNELLFGSEEREPLKKKPKQ